MSLEVIRPELIQALAPLGLVALGMALSTKQREAIRERDNHKCQAPFNHRCNMHKKQTGAVHHIIPQAYAEHHLHEPEKTRDAPERVILICDAAHKMIHPDLDAASMQFGYNRESYAEMSGYHRESAKVGRIYWFGKWDKQMLDIAKNNTMRALKKGWQYPDHFHRNGNGHNGKH